MYHAAGYGLGIKLLDNNGLPILTENGDDTFINGWGDNTSLSLTREEIDYETIWENAHCIGVNFIEPESNQELLARAPVILMEPQRQYRAEVWANTDHKLYEFPFSTSRYASFLHHIHDFQDAVWDHMRLLENPNFAIDQSILQIILDNQAGYDESVQFEQLMDLFDLNPRPLPNQLEIMLLNDQSQSYGLLLESPEPIPAERVQQIELHKFAPSNASPIEPFAGAVKLIGAKLQRDRSGGIQIITFNETWIELLLLDTTDLSGYQVEIKAHSEQDDLMYTQYYTFGANSIYKAGTKIIIYNGAAPSVPNDDEHVSLMQGIRSIPSLEMEPIFVWLIKPAQHCMSAFFTTRMSLQIRQST